MNIRVTLILFSTIFWPVSANNKPTCSLGTCTFCKKAVTAKNFPGNIRMRCWTHLTINTCCADLFDTINESLGSPQMTIQEVQIPKVTHYIFVTTAITAIVILGLGIGFVSKAMQFLPIRWRWWKFNSHAVGRNS